MEEIRYLTEGEKQMTRHLWETIFPEDVGAFLDYYYSVKTKDNEILAAELDGQFRAMLQLNPYHLQIGDTSAECAYVIAVATEEKYRHRGLMRKLLQQAMRDRYEKKQPFLFLIPADEAIYHPFGFRFVMKQNHKEIEPEKACGYQLELVAEKERGEAAGFANAILRQCADVYALRDACYYDVLQKEAEAESGAVCWIMKSSAIDTEADEKIGLLSYASDTVTEVREPLLKKEQEADLADILRSCFPGRQIHAYGLQPGMNQTAKCTIMIRPLYLPALFEGMRSEEEREFILRIHDRLIPENDGVFVWRVNQEESCLRTEWMPCRQGLDLDVSIEALTQLLFGFKSIEEISRSEHLIMSPQARRKWKKVKTWNRVCLNEVV